MRIQAQFRPLLVAAAVLPLASALFAGTGGAQAPDARWRPWLGCWTPTTAPVSGARTGGEAGGLVCVVPALRGAGVDVATIDNGVVVHRERVNATGERTPRTMDKCPGWESASWSADGRRLLLRSEYVCGPSTTVKGSGVFAMSPDGDFLQVQGSSVGSRTSARVVRYVATGRSLAAVPGGELIESTPVQVVEEPVGFAIRSVREAAGAAVRPEDVIEVAKSVDGPVAEAWLHEVGQVFALDGRTLVHLADAGMPPRMIDLMVAMAYPQRFAVTPRAAADRMDPASRGGAYGAAGGYAGTYLYGSRWDCGYGNRMLAYGYYGDSCYPGYYGLNGYGYYGYGYGYGYGGYSNGYYWGPQTIVVEPRTGDGSGRSDGVAVKGQGYTRRDSPPSQTTTRSNVNSGSSGSSGSSSSSGSASGSSGSSGSSGGGRTAQPRKP